MISLYTYLILIKKLQDQYGANSIASVILTNEKKNICKLNDIRCTNAMGNRNDDKLIEINMMI